MQEMHLLACVDKTQDQLVVITGCPEITVNPLYNDTVCSKLSLTLK